MTTRTHERRAFARAPHQTAAILATGRGDVSAEVVDLSVGGLGLRLSAPLLPGEFVRVRIQLPTAEGPRWFDPDAVVARVERNARGQKIGLRLVSPPAPLRAAIAQAVSAHLNRPARPPTAASTPGSPRPSIGAVAHPATTRRELAQLYRSALDSLSGDGKKKRKKPK